jgi:hypothetical protein
MPDTDEGAPGEELRALARMVEYASLEAKKNGLLLTGHLLDLAGWSLLEEKPEPSAAVGSVRGTVWSQKPN